MPMTPEVEVPFGGPLGTPTLGGLAWYHLATPDNPEARPAIRCVCGQFLSLARQWIAPDGRCRPMVYHSGTFDLPGCGFRAMVRLLDYTGPEREPVERRRPWWLNARV